MKLPMTPELARGELVNHAEGALYQGKLNRRDFIKIALAAGVAIKMGTDEMAVVDGKLAVRGVDGLTVADASIMPRVATSNTMAPTCIIGERAADILTS